MTVFCTDNMTNNIQYGVTSHCRSVSGGATAKRLEGIVIGMGCTIGIPSISQWRGCTGWIRNCVKGAEPKSLGTSVPLYGLGQIRGTESGG